MEATLLAVVSGWHKYSLGGVLCRTYSVSEIRITVSGNWFRVACIQGIAIRTLWTECEDCQHNISLITQHCQPVSSHVQGNVVGQQKMSRKVLGVQGSSLQLVSPWAHSLPAVVSPSVLKGSKAGSPTLLPHLTVPVYEGSGYIMCNKFSKITQSYVT